MQSILGMLGRVMQFTSCPDNEKHWFHNVHIPNVKLCNIAFTNTFGSMGIIYWQHHVERSAWFCAFWQIRNHVKMNCIRKRYSNSWVWENSRNFWSIERTDNNSLFKLWLIVFLHFNVALLPNCLCEQSGIYIYADMKYMSGD